MIEITQRPLKESERIILIRQIPDKWKYIADDVLLFVVILFVLISPLLLFDKYWFDVPPVIELIVLVPLLVIAFVVTYRRTKKMHDSRTVKDDVEAGIVIGYHVKTNRVIKRKNSDDLGPCYYFDLGSDSQFKTLFLFGQYLMDYKKASFPCSEFQIVKSKSGLAIDIVTSGQPLKPVRRLSAFTQEDFISGKVYEDGQLLTIPIDEIE